jgi:hypothetical protein
MPFFSLYGTNEASVEDRSDRLTLLGACCTTLSNGAQAGAGVKVSFFCFGRTMLDVCQKYVQ